MTGGRPCPLREGRVPEAAERRVAVLGDTAAASLGKKPGDELELLGETFRVVGIANYTTIVKTEWPVLNLRVAYFGQ